MANTNPASKPRAGRPVRAAVAQKKINEGAKSDQSKPAWTKGYHQVIYDEDKLREISQGILEDPLSEAGTATEERRDHMEVTLDAAACMTRTEYANTTGKPLAVVWRFASALAQVANGVTRVEPRGMVSDVKGAKVTIENMLQDNIEVAINTPKAKIGSGDEIALRTSTVNRVLKPGGKFTYHTNWREQINVFQPVLQPLTDEAGAKFHGMRVADVCVVIPNESAQANEPYAKDREVCKMTVEVTYHSEKVDELLKVANVTLENKDIWQVATLPNVRTMKQVTPEIIATYAGGRATTLASGVIQWQENTTLPLMSIQYILVDGRYHVKLIKADNTGLYAGNVEVAPYQQDNYELIAPIGLAYPQQAGYPGRPDGIKAADLSIFLGNFAYRFDKRVGAWLQMGVDNRPFSINKGYLWEAFERNMPCCSARAPLTLYDTRAVTYDEEGRAVDPEGPYALTLAKIIEGVSTVAKTWLSVAGIVSSFL